MKIVPVYENSVAVIPSRVIDCLSDATGDDMAVLIAALRDGAAFDPSSACAELGIDRDTLDSALKFWEDRGIITVDKRARGKGSRSVPFGQKNAGRTAGGSRRPALGPTQPDIGEQAAYLESHKPVAQLIDGLGDTLKKTLSRNDIATVIGLLDRLGVEPAYLMLLAAYAADHGKKAIRYVEAMADELYDRGITSYQELEEELSAREKAEDFEGTVRRIFGLGKRALTKKEKEYIRAWHVDWGYGEDVLTEAYEITVSSTNEASLPYANAIIEKWRSLGITTVEEAREYQKKTAGKKKSGKSSKPSGKSSFDTDDFFEAALKRSYGDK